MEQQQEQPSRVETWVYPFSLANPGARPAPEDYFRALSASEDGFYPLGANGLWHGGIHFGQGTAGKFDQGRGVKCIADGEDVAYRINAKIQELTYPGGIKAGYSSGFTLVRHRLVFTLVSAKSVTLAITGILGRIHRDGRAHVFALLASSKDCITW